MEDGGDAGGGSSVENVGETALVAVDPVGERGQSIRRHSPISGGLLIRNSTSISLWSIFDMTYNFNLHPSSSLREMCQFACLSVLILCWDGPPQCF